VHLGAMQEAVKYQIELYNRKHGEQLENGDVILVNHPACGGSHLPDLTIITPVCVNKDAADASGVFVLSNFLRNKTLFL
jgi:5-oxoprolinase (ATP-hydrolysing)